MHERRDDRLRLAGLVRARRDQGLAGRGVQPTYTVRHKPELSRALSVLPPVLNLASLIPLNGAEIASVRCVADADSKVQEP